MKTNAICTFPLYSGIFLNKKSKYTLLSEDSNPLKPKHRHNYAHHVTLKFNPGGDFSDIKWGASVEMNVVRHIFNDNGQAIEVVPTLLKYKVDKDNVVEVSEKTEINKLLSGNSERKYNITISLNDIQNNDLSPARLDEVMMLSDEELRSKGYTVESVDGVTLSGFVAVYSNVRLERNSLEFLRRKGKKPRRVGYDPIPPSRRRF